MAKNWYPIVDYTICIECGACLKRCKRGVYKKYKAPKPIVIAPINCIDHCHSCGNICPVGAITYFGDDTGWMPPKRK